MSFELCRLLNEHTTHEALNSMIRVHAQVRPIGLRAAADGHTFERNALVTADSDSLRSSCNVVQYFATEPLGYRLSDKLSRRRVFMVPQDKCHS